MSESRDRLVRPVDISTLLPNAARRVDLTVYEPGLSRGLLSFPVRPRPGVYPNNGLRREGGVGVGQLGLGRVLSLNRSPIGRENVSARIVRRARARGRARNSVLPAGYPRTPLGDITAVVRAIDRRRARMREVDAPETPAPSGANETRIDQLQIESSSRFQLEPEMSETTPLPILCAKKGHHPSPASRMWSIVARIADEDRTSEFVTPQKKLMNSIEKVREVFLEEQRKMEKTPAAKKAERERKVRVLMSMR